MQGAHQATIIPPQQLDSSEKNMIKDSWVKIRTGKSNTQHTVMGRTDSAWGNYFIYYQSNQSRVVAKKNPNSNLKKTFLSLFPPSQFNFTPNFLYSFTPFVEDKLWEV